MQMMEITKAAAIIVNAALAEKTCRIVPTSPAAISPPTCMQKKLLEFETSGFRCAPTDGIIACEAVRATRSHAANSTAEKNINHGRFVDMSASDPTDRRISATMNTTLRGKRSDSQPAIGLTSNSVRLTMATNVATAALPLSEATRIHEHATA
ncbi:hypothetical protein D3C80_1478480 [compost metagenome]